MADDAPAWLQDAAASVGLEAVEPSPPPPLHTPSADYVPFGQGTPSGHTPFSPLYVAPDFSHAAASQADTPGSRGPDTPGMGRHAAAAVLWEGAGL